MLVSINQNTIYEICICYKYTLNLSNTKWVEAEVFSMAIRAIQIRWTFSVLSPLFMVDMSNLT